MKFLTGLLLILASFNSYSQNGNILVKFCPLALADEFSFPTIQAGIEFKLSKKITWYNEIGIKYGSSNFNATDSNFIKSAGFKLKTEVRYYFRGRDKGAFDGFYTGANVFYTQNHYNTEVPYFINGTTDARDAFGVKKRILGANLICGRQIAFSKRWMLDAYCGIGIRYRNVRTINKDYNKNTDKLYQSIDVNVPSILADIDANGGNEILQNVTMGVRLCFKL